MTIDEARSRLADDLALVKRNARTLASESGCPEAIPDTSGGTTE